MIGRKLLQYEITAELGAGAMGHVYLARDSTTDRRVALKFLSAEAASSPEARERFLREARAGARLSHPGIVMLHAVEEAEGRLFLVEEFVEGETLAARLARGPLGPQEALRLARELTAGLAHAHHHGVLHRDLKPANVLIAADGSYKIADFGIARFEGAPTLTSTGVLLGTLPYLAPERLRGATGDARADLFALGAVFYEAMTGRRAFGGATESEAMYAVLNVEPPEPVVAASLAPLAALTLRLMAKEPSRRPASAEALLEALEAMRAAAPPVARRRAWLAPALGALALAVLLSALWWARGRIPPPAEGEPAVAVLYFDNLADPRDSARIGPISGSLLITSLAQAPRLNVLSTQRIVDAMRQVGQHGATLDRTVALQVAKRARATRIVTGSILQVAPAVVMTAEVSEVGSGRVLYAERVEGGPGQTVFQVVDALGARLMQKMARPDEVARLAPVAQRTSTDLEAQRRYLDGMEHLSSGDLATADSLFAAAVARDPGFPQAWYQLAFTRWWLNEDEAAVADIQNARAHSERLSPLEREILEGLFELVEGRPRPAAARFETLARAHADDKMVLYGLEESRFHNGDWEGTIGVARQILALDPDFTLAGRHLVDALGLAGRYGEAQAVGQELIRRSPRNVLLFDGLMGLASQNLDAELLFRLEKQQQAVGLRPASLALALIAVARESAAVAPALLLGYATQPWMIEQARLGTRYYVALRKGRYREALNVAGQAWRAHGGRKPSTTGNVPWADGYHAAVSLPDSIGALRYSEMVADRVFPANPSQHAPYRASLRAAAWLAMGHPDNARRELTELDTLTALAHFGLTLLLESEGRYAEALEALKVSRWNGFPDMAAELKLTRARVLRGLGRRTEALNLIDSLMRCPTLYPDDAVKLHLERGRVLDDLSRPAEAAAEYREFLRLWKDADPGRPEVAEARAALARIEHGPGATITTRARRLAATQTVTSPSQSAGNAGAALRREAA